MITKLISGRDHTSSSFLDELDISLTLTFVQECFSETFINIYHIKFYLPPIVMKLHFVNFLLNEYWIGLDDLWRHLCMSVHTLMYSCCRVCLPPVPFLVVLFSTVHSKPEFYECVTVNGRRQVDFALSTCRDVVQLSRVRVLSACVYNGSKQLVYTLCHTVLYSDSQSVSVGLSSHPKCAQKW